VCDNITNISTITGSLLGGNTFVAGAGQAETFKGGSLSTANTVDFSNLTTPTFVNVAQPGLSLQSIAFGMATSGGTTYDFTNFDAVPTRFIGNGAGTTFFAGSIGNTFVGQNQASDTLSFADAPGTKLQVCVAGGTGPNGPCPPGVAVLGTVNEPFSGIETFDGLGGSTTTTTFLGNDSSGGYTFAGTGEPTRPTSRRPSTRSRPTWLPGR
jgi:hypothetical protein